MLFNHTFARTFLTSMYQTHRNYLNVIPNSSKAVSFPGLEICNSKWLRKYKPVIKTYQKSLIKNSHDFPRVVLTSLEVITSTASIVCVYMVKVESNRNFPYPSLVEKNRRKQPKKLSRSALKKAS